MSSYSETIDYLYGLLRLGIRPGLGTIKKLLNSLENPQNSYPSVLVAGTNGKGSTAAFIESMLAESGLKTGLYTSPHLMRFNERIRISGTPLSDRDVARLARSAKSVSDKVFRSGKGPTFFEFTTAMAFLYFKEKKVDMAVLEAGMGGRLDATNVVTPLVSVITSIGLDHTKNLGETLEGIAREKAGIIKAGVPVVTGVEGDKASKVIKGTARRLGAPVYCLGDDFKIEGRKKCFNYYGLGKNFFSLKAGLLGSHQRRNAALALASLELLKERGYDVPEDAVRRGLKEVFWPGRLEVVSSKNRTVVLDCAHNPDGARALARAISELWPGKKLTLVIGVMKDKDIDGIFKALLPLSDSVIFTAPALERAAMPGSLAERAKPFLKKTVVVEKVSDACKAALSNTIPGDLVCVTGSVFTVGEAMGFFKGSA